jgi:pyruvate dehydrogenase E1 component alpha subunit
LVKKANFYGGHGNCWRTDWYWCGLAFAEQYRGTDNVCLTFFGDGAAVRECYMRSLTWHALEPACHFYLPENNNCAMGTSLSVLPTLIDIYKLADGYEMAF